MSSEVIWCTACAGDGTGIEEGYDHSRRECWKCEGDGREMIGFGEGRYPLTLIADDFASGYAYAEDSGSLIIRNVLTIGNYNLMDAV